MIVIIQEDVKKRGGGDDEMDVYRMEFVVGCKFIWR
jgi:hypothetical protein